MAIDGMQVVVYGIVLPAAGAVVGWWLVAGAQQGRHHVGTGGEASAGIPWWSLGAAPAMCLLLALTATGIVDRATGQAGALAMMGAVAAVGAAASGHLAAKCLAVTGPDPEWRPKALTLTIVLLTPVVFTFVIFFLASSGGSDGLPTVLLWTMGAGAAATVLLQDAVASKPLLEAAARDPMGYGRLLVRVVVPEALVLAAFVFVFVQMPEPVPAA